jgi:hypothetical protein
MLRIAFSVRVKNSEWRNNMLKNALSLWMVIVLLQVAIRPGVAASRGDNSEAQVNKVKADIAKRGLGEKATVRVKLRNKEELKGYIAEAGEDRFLLTVSKINESVPVAYSDVLEVKSQSLASNVMFWIGAGALATGVVAVMAFSGAGL